MRVLLATLPATGHVNPMMAVAAALIEKHHDVVFVTGQQYAAEVSGLPVHFTALAYPQTAYENIMASFSRPLPHFPRLLWDRPHAGFFSLLPEITSQLIQIIRQAQPDVILADYNFYAGAIAAEVCGIPYATFCAIVNALPSKDTPAFGARLDWKPPYHPERVLWPFLRWGSRVYLSIDDRKVNHLRKFYGLPTVDFPTFGVTPYLFIVPTTEAYEYPRTDLPPQVVYVGPVLRQDTSENHFPWEWLEDQRPTLFVSMGTIVKVRRVFETVIQLAKNAPWKAVLAVGKGVAVDEFGSVPENILLQNFVPQREILPKVDAVISHGGNNTVTETLFHGKPLIIVPITGDQPESAGRIQHSGAGIRLRIQDININNLQKSIDKVLYEPRFRENAARIQASYRACDGPRTTVRLLEKLAACRAALYRGDEMPPTLTHPDEVDHLTPKLCCQ